MQIFGQENLKVNKNKCTFRYTRVLFFGKIVSGQGMQIASQKLYLFT